MCCKRLHCGKEGSSGIEQRTLADVGEALRELQAMGARFSGGNPISLLQPSGTVERRLLLLLS